MNTILKNKNFIFIASSILIITIIHYTIVGTKFDVHDFYRRLYYIPIIWAAFKFRFKGGVIAAYSVSILYAPHLLQYFGEINIEVINQFFEIGMFLIVGTITGYLVESDYKKKNMLENQIKKLTELENYTQSILDSITNVFIAFDKNLRIQAINSEGEKIFNLDNNHADKELSSFFVDYEYVESILMDVFKYNKRILNIETKCISKDGVIVYVKFFAYPMRNSLNNINGVVIVLEDISKIRKLEKQVRRAEKLSAAGELASGVAHEIRNPLGIIKTITQTINEDIDCKEVKEGLNIVIEEVDRANAVIRSLLDFAKPNVYKRKMDYVDKLLNDILLITNKYAQKNNVDINYESEKSIRLYMDLETLKQAFINIIFNSVQAMPNGGNIKILVFDEENWAKLSFIDNGIGICKEKIEKIFEPFYTTKDTGTGLGLAITHRIIEEHNGYIEIYSEVGKGTKLDVYLPMISMEGENDE